MIQHQIEIYFRITFIKPFEDSQMSIRSSSKTTLSCIAGWVCILHILASPSLHLVLGAHHCFNSARIDAFVQC